MKDEDYKWRKLIDGWPELVDRLRPVKCPHRYVEVFVSGPPISGTVRCNDCGKEVPELKVEGAIQG